MDRKHRAVMLDFLFIFALAAFGTSIGYLFGSSQAHTAALAMEKGIVQELTECKTNARFGMGDEGTSYHKYTYNEEILEGIVHRAWMRCDHKDCYWQTDEGYWGISEGNPMFPWITKLQQGE